MVRSRLAALGAVIPIVGATVLQSSRVHGLVTDGDGAPIADAYVWVADAERVRLQLMTDADGRFHTWHRPFALREGSMLICAPGHSTMLRDEIVRAWFVSFRIGAWPAGTPHAPQPAAGWTFAAPAACAERLARGSS